MTRFQIVRSSIAGALAGVALLLSLNACGSGPEVGVIPEHPDLTGTWLFNPDESDQPEDEDRSPPGPPGREPSASRTRIPMSAGFMPSVAFRIEEQDSALVFIDAQGRQRTIYQDGRPFRQRVEGLGILGVQAWWDGDEFVVRKQLESGPTITETYALRNEGRQLTVEIKIIARRRIEFVRVYDRANGP
ncbi:MAG: hypothetical protein GWN99_00205 [Gemmatimonadetes bacterium]|uniref:Uncharacterized protein n=1 Tax=Candidatus Kutchimonas denitrificans TaxID=3056748 RepID=A0AAE5CBX8_9BACT|nr:hypothetical protein [Gemmatimonadota bacterium]NIR73529.1 hypothetical protein [Candidatus Kutchimonas denitrificans]NIR99488.1 hypothetical protein [Gemmatimonadota bacterium]NIT65108.1 hypothetical protein [Gemmatimonadota bacterium]NIV23641.1 hypothetical protein [Gemmatimonadota bacterium]